MHVASPLVRSTALLMSNASNKPRRRGKAWGGLRGMSRVMRGRQHRIRTITMTAAVFGSFAMIRCLVEPRQRIVEL
jgi:hypothetical protein